MLYFECRCVFTTLEGGNCSGHGASSPYSGSYACAIGNLASGALQSASMAVSGNKQYDLYAWVNGKLDAADSAGGWHVRALYYTAGSAYIGYKDVYSGTAESSSLTWQQVGGRLLTPANAASVRLELRVEGVSGWLDFDNVSLQEVLTVNLVYDAENRLVKVLQNGTSMAAFGYDGDGVRVKQTLTTTTPTSTYFVKNYYEVSGGSVTKYYYLGSQRVAMRSSVGVRYLFGDHLGSTSVSADVSGGSVTKQLYKAFGETRFTSGSLPSKYQYTGQYSNMSDFGLMFYNARWFDPALARFSSADTIIPGAGNPAAWDRYAGMLNNPMRYRDPSGHKTCVDDYCGTYNLNHDIKILESLYGINFHGNGWTTELKLVVLFATMEIGHKIATAIHELSDSGVFHSIFGGINLTLKQDLGTFYGQTTNVKDIAFRPDKLTERLFGHELGHVFDNIMYKMEGDKYADTHPIELLLKGLYASDGEFLTGENRHGDGQYNRNRGLTGLESGYQCDTVPCQYHLMKETDPSIKMDGANTPSEEWADMFLNWGLGGFSPTKRGDFYKSWMTTNMVIWASMAR